MENVVNRFLSYLEVEKGFSVGTVDSYRLDLARVLLPFLRRRGRLDASEVTREDIRAFLDFLAYDRGNSSAARARKLAATKSLFNYLLETGELMGNPAALIRSPKIVEKTPVFLTDDECIKLLEVISRKGKRGTRKRDIAIVVLFLHTGIRVTELVGLKAIDVDLADCRIKVSRKRSKEQYLHLNPEAVKVLTQYAPTRSGGNDANFFVGLKGKGLSRNWIYFMLRRYLKLADIDKGKYGPHILRHTFCTRLHRKGVAPFVIRDLAGHKSLETTMRYVNIESKEQIEAVNRLQFGSV